jgi:hypothetical protein
MKKAITLFAVFIFLSGTLFAQTNSSDVRQDGADNSAAVNQTGASNTFDYGVKGEENTLNTDQTGTGNTAYINQETWYDQPDAFQAYNNLNVVTSSQNGEENWIDAKLKGDENIINFIQDGSMNIIFGFGGVGTEFKYEGDYSEIDIEQINEGNMVKGDISGTNQDVDVYQISRSPGNVSEITIDAFLGSSAPDQMVDIEQDGENESYVTITGNGNSVKHNQYGEDNDGANPGTNMATTTIEGDYNSSDIEQEGQGNMATHTQQGSAVYHNEAQTLQDGIDNEAEIIQKGDNNYAYQDQDVWNGSADPDDDNNEADDNYSRINQQWGTWNHAESWQFGDDNSNEIIQDGHRNEAYVFQGKTDRKFGIDNASHGNDNWAKINQYGDDNAATVMQDGDGNQSLFSTADYGDCPECVEVFGTDHGEWWNTSVMQSGNNNDALTEITGDFNNTAQYQWENANDADIMINGNSNFAKQLQWANPTGAAVSTINITGSGNLAGSAQWGANSSTITVTGNGNKACVEQHNPMP